MVSYLNQTCLWEGPTSETIKLHWLDQMILRQNDEVGCLILSRVALSEADIL